jgi:XTP/dITP diphosphohydrolase
LASDRKILLATRSAGKLRELHGILAEAGLEGMTLDEAKVPVSDDEEHIEAFSTFEENALAKARYFNRLTGLPTMADDSGLSVDALGGAPGVWSKRYSDRNDLSGQALDDANNEKLLRELSGVADRRARYSCAAAFADGPLEAVAIGEVYGSIVDHPRGTEGFGYDPYFLASELGCTFGEASIADKQVVSHRGRAFRALVDALRRHHRAL